MNSSRFSFGTAGSPMDASDARSIGIRPPAPHEPMDSSLCPPPGAILRWFKGFGHAPRFVSEYERNIQSRSVAIMRTNPSPAPSSSAAVAIQSSSTPTLRMSHAPRFLESGNRSLEPASDHAIELITSPRQ